MENLLNRFSHDEIGSHTVDWLVLGAGMLAITIALSASFGSSLQLVASDSEAAPDRSEPLI
ncbi:MAG: hypothetical protein ACC631_07755 [Halocynthiibacter sp.]